MSFSNAISATDFEALVNGIEPFHLLDIRTDTEYEEFNLGGIHIPLEDLFSNIAQVEHLREEEVIVICFTGFQSEAARAILAKKGFLKIRNLEGGLAAMLLE
jgi:rhodanese-related sulfurtransferase